MKIRKLPLIAFIIAMGCFATRASAQAINTPTYRNAIGLRAGGTSGLTFKHFFATGNAMEFIVGVWPNAVSLTGLYEKHTASPSLSGFSWYYGLGAHAAFYTRDRYYYRYPEDRPHYRRYRYEGDAIGIGIDGILGVEYKIPPIPFALSFDLKPNIEGNTDGYFYMAIDPGLGIKFTF